MSTTEQTNSGASQPATDPSSQASQASQAGKRQRVLACVLCQQRKVKCDRKFPCANCLRSKAQCVPAAMLGPRERRRRFPERELLDRLRHYESLLRQNNISFQPLHRDATIADQSVTDAQNEGHGPESQGDEQQSAAADEDRPMSPCAIVKPDLEYEARNFWHALYQTADSQAPNDNSSDEMPDEVTEVSIKKIWKEMNQTNRVSDSLLFSSRGPVPDLSTQHPEQVQIFRLWQTYINNVNPLIRVIHIPTMQEQIIDAAGSLSNISPTMEALIFSIYCISVLSLSKEQCRTMFGCPKEDLLKKYQVCCQQALQNCGFLRSGERDSLIALYLYLISVRPSTDPQSLSSMLGIALRIAQRMGLHNESTYTKRPVLESEMCRRLWWSLVLFDSRICELTAYKTCVLTPTWDCRIPRNVSDYDLRSDMKDPPPAQEKSTEALFAVARSDVGDSVRHSSFHLDFISPALKTIAREIRGSRASEGSEIAALENVVEEKYFRFCDPENPLHFMTMWTIRGYLAKSRLYEHFTKLSRSRVPQTDLQRDVSVSHALNMLKCDSNLKRSPHIRRYQWFTDFHFPFPAYIHLCQDLKKRPQSDHAEQSWETMAENYDLRMEGQEDAPPFLKLFFKLIQPAWNAREAALRQAGKEATPPRMVLDVQRRAALMMQGAPNTAAEQPSDVFYADFDFSVPPTPDSGNGGYALPFTMGGPSQGGPGPLGFGRRPPFPGMPGSPALGIDMNQFSVTPMDWNPMQGFFW